MRLSGSGWHETFHFLVQGSGAASYNVDVPMLAPSSTTCSCPDFSRSGHVCKHIIGLMLGVVLIEPDAVEMLPEPPGAAESGAGSSTDAHRIAGPAPLAVPPQAPPPAPPRSLTQQAHDSDVQRRNLELELAAARRALRYAEGRARLAEYRAARAKAPLPVPAGPAAAPASALAGPAAAHSSQNVSFVSAASTLGSWIRILGEAREVVRIVCFTFDSPHIVDALLQARTRDIVVKFIFSGRDRHLTRNQEPRLQQLRAAGCQVRAYQRVRCHAKVVMGDNWIVVGSCNLTDASQGNVERSVVYEMGADERELNERWFENLFDSAAPFDGGQGRVPETPPRQGASPPGR